MVGRVRGKSLHRFQPQKSVWCVQALNLVNPGGNAIPTSLATASTMALSAKTLAAQDREAKLLQTVNTFPHVFSALVWEI